MWGCGLAHGAPSILGATGVLVTPNAEVVGKGALEVGAHFADGNVPFVGEAELGVYKGTVGLSERLELTGALVSVEREATVGAAGTGVGRRQNGPRKMDDDELTVHVKYKLVSPPGEGCCVAVGVMDLFQEVADPILYAAVGRTAGDTEAGERLVRATAGLAFANDIGGSGDDEEFFSSLEAELSDRLMALLEFFGDDVSFGGRFCIGDLNVDVASVESGGGREFVFGGAYRLSW
jgi:hypothetical protein